MTRPVKFVAMVGMIVGLMVGWAAGGVRPVGAQAVAPEAATSAGTRPAVEVTVPAPPPREVVPGVRLEPSLPSEQTGAREQEFYPGAVRSQHAPAFVTPFVRTVPVSRSSAVRGGLSAWTAPAVPFDIRQSSGGAAVGFTFVWGVPVPEDPASEPRPTERR